MLIASPIRDKLISTRLFDGKHTHGRPMASFAQLNTYSDMYAQIREALESEQYYTASSSTVVTPSDVSDQASNDWSWTTAGMSIAQLMGQFGAVIDSDRRAEIFDTYVFVF